MFHTDLTSELARLHTDDLVAEARARALVRDAQRTRTDRRAPRFRRAR